MADQSLLVLDAGTTSTRAMLFAPDGRVQGSAQHPITQHYPRDGWVEHDAAEIWRLTLAAARAMVEEAGGPGRIAAIGIANQRETVVAWDKDSGTPLARAIVWQDRRTASMCAALREAGHEPALRRATGLMLDPYFSATKMRWLIDHEPPVAAAAEAGRLALGTVESWLAFNLTGGLHISDASNASRTLLLGLEQAQWDAGLCDLFGVPIGALPQVVDTHGPLGQSAPGLFGAPIPITGLAGDQQAATIGQNCLAPGATKATYGTGAFVLASTGTVVPHSAHRLLGTVLAQQSGQRLYALEGSVFVAGSLLGWLRDVLGLVGDPGECEALARTVPDSAGAVIVPALAGLGAPHWRPEARGLIAGLSFATTRAHLARAALEAMAHQTHDLAGAFAADGAAWSALKIDGGMAGNDWMAQDLADLLDLPVTRPAMIETTALGAAVLAATGAGLYPSLAEAAAAMAGASQQFAPRMGTAEREARLARWREALARL